VFTYRSIRADAVVENPKRFLTSSRFRRDKRQFEMRCLSPRYEPGFPCPDAFGDFWVHEPLKAPTEYERVLHLREPRFNLSFDAPDDSWLGVGPHSEHTPAGETGTSWQWTTDDNRHIDVAVYDLPASIAAGPDTFAALLATHFRSTGKTVTVKASELAGRPCDHLELDWRTGPRQDLFIQRRGRLQYTVVVTAPTHDPDLLDRTRAGFRLDEPLRP
jgi:hypothetical protein